MNGVGTVAGKVAIVARIAMTTSTVVTFGGGFGGGNRKNSRDRECSRSFSGGFGGGNCEVNREQENHHDRGEFPMRGDFGNRADKGRFERGAGRSDHRSLENSRKRDDPWRDDTQHNPKEEPCRSESRTFG